jgi:hypothetical protein
LPASLATAALGPCCCAASSRVAALRGASRAERGDPCLAGAGAQVRSVPRGGGGQGGPLGHAGGARGSHGGLRAPHAQPAAGLGAGAHTVPLGLRRLWGCCQLRALRSCLPGRPAALPNSLQEGEEASSSAGPSSSSSSARPKASSSTSSGVRKYSQPDWMHSQTGHFSAW